jgi:serine/threonine-protein kinase RsbW
LEGIHYQQTYGACFDCLSEVSTLIHKAAQSAGLDERSTYQVETAVDEACSNIIEHAYGGENRGEIEIECICTPGELTIRLCDTGRPFDPGEIQVPDLTLSLEDRPDHGLGLFFMHRWMDSIRFDISKTGGNILTMVKKAKQAL